MGRMEKRSLHSPAVLLLFTACGTATAGPRELSFEMRGIDLGHSTGSVVILDQDRDGSPDLLATVGGTVTVLRGDGTGGFEILEGVDAGEHPVDLAPGDLDGDGWLDLVVPNHETTYVTLLFGGPDGFTPDRRQRLDVDVSPHLHAAAVGDVDEDGHLDMVVDDRDRERLRLYLGQGDGTFEAGEPIPVGGDPYRGMTLADVDGDAHLDIVTPNPRNVAIQLGDGTGGFSAGPRLDSNDVPPFNTTTGDFDGDGIQDLAAGSGEGPGRVVVWLGSGGGEFTRSPGSPYAIAEGPTRLSTGEVDGDGVDDVLVTSYVEDEIAVLHGGREGLRVTRIELEDSPWGAAAGDVNGDGRTDLATANDTGSGITLLVGRGG